MNEPLDEDSPDEFGGFEYRLLLDDLSASAKRKPPRTTSKNRPEPRKSSLLSERKVARFESSVEKNSPTPSESSFKRVYDLLNEQESEPAGAPASERKPKKDGKHLTPETNYTQKDYELWGSYKWSRDEAQNSKRTLTAFSEAFEPDGLSLGPERTELFGPGLDGFRAARVPKKLSFAGPDLLFDPRDSPKQHVRKLSFQDKPLAHFRDPAVRFRPADARRTPRKKLADFVKPGFDRVFDLLSDRLAVLISEKRPV